MRKSFDPTNTYYKKILSYCCSEYWAIIRFEKLILIKEEGLRILIREEIESVIKKSGQYDSQDIINNTYLNIE